MTNMVSFETDYTADAEESTFDKEFEKTFMYIFDGIYLIVFMKTFITKNKE